MLRIIEIKWHIFSGVCETMLRILFYLFSELTEYQFMNLHVFRKSNAIAHSIGDIIRLQLWHQTDEFIVRAGCNNISLAQARAN